MYKEIVKSKGNRHYTRLMGIVAIGLVVLWALDALASYFGWQYRMLYQLASVVGVCALSYPLIRHELAEYYYCIADSRLLLNTKMGIRDIVLLDVAVQDICYIAPVGMEKKEQEKPFTVYEARKTVYKDIGYVGYFRSKNRLCKFYFEPSDELVERLRDLGVTLND